jgi:hypothetical protein
VHGLSSCLSSVLSPGDCGTFREALPICGLQKALFFSLGFEQSNRSNAGARRRLASFVGSLTFAQLG